MKKIALIALFPLVTSTTVRAQWGADVVLFIIQAAGTCDEVGYEYKQTLFANKVGALHGAKFGWAPGERFRIGVSAYFGTNRVTPWNSNDLHMLDFTCGNIYGEYHFRDLDDDKFYDWSVIAQAGRGYGAIRGSNVPSSFQNTSTFWIFEPGGNFNLYLLRIIRFHVGVSYRIVSGSRLYGQTDWTLSGPCLNAGISIVRRRF